MLHVCFSDAEYGDIQNKYKSKKNENQVIQINLYLAYGNLNEKNIRKNRITEITQIFGNEYKTCITEAFNNLDKLINTPSKEDLCFWCNEIDCNDMLGFYYLCSLFLERENKIYMGTFKNEPYLEPNNKITKFTKKEVFTAAEKWKLIVQENKTLRIMDEGKVLSVKEDFYDELILAADHMRKFYKRTDINDVSAYVFLLIDQPINHYWIMYRYFKIKKGRPVNE